MSDHLSKQANEQSSVRVYYDQNPAFQMKLFEEVVLRLWPNWRSPQRGTTLQGKGKLLCNQNDADDNEKNK